MSSNYSPSQPGAVSDGCIALVPAPARRENSPWMRVQSCSPSPPSALSHLPLAPSARIYLLGRSGKHDLEAAGAVYSRAGTGRTVRRAAMTLSAISPPTVQHGRMPSNTGSPTYSSEREDGKPQPSPNFASTADPKRGAEHLRAVADVGPESGVTFGGFHTFPGLAMTSDPRAGAERISSKRISPPKDKKRTIPCLVRRRSHH